MDDLLEATAFLILLVVLGAILGGVIYHFGFGNYQTDDAKEILGETQIWEYQGTVTDLDFSNGGYRILFSDGTVLDLQDYEWDYPTKPKEGENAYFRVLVWGKWVRHGLGPVEFEPVVKELENFKILEENQT